MLAETAYNVINALSEKEVKRLYGMLGVVDATVSGPPKRNLDGMATEYLIKKLDGKNDMGNKP